jgi:hypothetical protein
MIFTTPLLYTLALACFGSSLPSSGNFLDPSELLEIRIEWVVYNIMCGYVTCVSDSRGSGTTIFWYTGYVTTHYMIYHLLDLYFK